MNIGNNYVKTNERCRSIISAWNNKPNPLEFNKTKYKSDIKGLKKHNLVRWLSHEIKYKFTIGMEVEKINFTRTAFTNGDMVGEYPLFLGYETDSTCGVEAVTNILPLLPASSWRTKIFGLMHDASSIIEDIESPSNFKCGGHITIGVEGMSSNDIYEAVRPNIGILYSLFRKRLLNTWCDRNLNGIFNGTDIPEHNGWHNKYCPVKLRHNNSIEFRLVSRFQSVKQMKDRYMLFFEIINFSINKPYGRYSTLMRKIKPILMSMYNQDEDKVDEVIAMSKHFRKYLMNKGLVIPEAIKQFVDVNGNNALANRRYRTRNCQLA